jgi:hypothetical protein
MTMDELIESSQARTQLNSPAATSMNTSPREKEKETTGNQINFATFHHHHHQQMGFSGYQ